MVWFFEPASGEWHLQAANTSVKCASNTSILLRLQNLTKLDCLDLVTVINTTHPSRHHTTLGTKRPLEGSPSWEPCKQRVVEKDNVGGLVAARVPVAAAAIPQPTFPIATSVPVTTIELGDGFPRRYLLDMCEGLESMKGRKASPVNTQDAFGIVVDRRRFAEAKGVWDQANASEEGKAYIARLRALPRSGDTTWDIFRRGVRQLKRTRSQSVQPVPVLALVSPGPAPTASNEIKGTYSAMRDCWRSH